MPRINVKDKRKQELIDANISSIAKRGLTETTIAHVSQGAGMSRGIVNFYFTTKESMMQETCQYLADEYAGVWQRAAEKLAKGASAEDALEAVVRGHFQASVCNQKKLSVWVAFWGHASSQAAYRKIIDAYDVAFERHLCELWEKAAKKRGLALSAETFAYELHALIRGSWLSFLLSAKTADRDVLAEKCLNYLRRCLMMAANDAPALVKAPVVLEAVASVEAQDNVTVLAGEKARKKAATTAAEESAAVGDLFALNG